MRFLKQSTAVSVTVGPLTDATGGITPETAVTATDITAGIIKGVTNAALSLTASGGNNDLVHIVNGYYSLELTASNTDTLGHARVHLRDDDVFLPIFEDFIVLAANVYDSLIGGGDVLDVSLTQVLGTAVTESTATAGVLDVNVAEISDGSTEADRLQAALGTGNFIDADVVRISDDSTAADNLELMYDGTGYAGGTAKLEVDVQEIDGDATEAAKLLAFCKSMTTGTVSDAGASSTDFDTSLTEATNDHYNGQVIVFTDGVLLGQRATIADYVGASKNVDVTGDAFTEAPGNGDAFIII